MHGGHAKQIQKGSPIWYLVPLNKTIIDGIDVLMILIIPHFSKERSIDIDGVSWHDVNIRFILLYFIETAMMGYLWLLILRAACGVMLQVIAMPSVTRRGRN